jgi:hypothetical protein
VYGLSIPTGLVLTADGMSAVVSSWGDQVATLLDRDAVTGELAFRSVTPPAIFTGGPTQVVSSPGGHRLYVDGWVAVLSAYTYERGGVGGDLRFEEALFDGQNGVTGINGLTSIAVSPDGRFVYGCSIGFDAGTHDSVAVFRVPCGEACSRAASNAMTATTPPATVATAPAASSPAGRALARGHAPRAP